MTATFCMSMTDDLPAGAPHQRRRQNAMQLGNSHDEQTGRTRTPPVVPTTPTGFPRYCPHRLIRDFRRSAASREGCAEHDLNYDDSGPPSRALGVANATELLDVDDNISAGMTGGWLWLRPAFLAVLGRFHLRTRCVEKLSSGHPISHPVTGLRQRCVINCGIQASCTALGILRAAIRIVHRSCATWRRLDIRATAMPYARGGTVSDRAGWRPRAAR